MGKGVILTSIVGPLVALVCIIYIAKNVTVKAWQDFLDSLSTVGGNIIILFIVFWGMLAVLIHVLMNADKEDAQIVTVVISTFAGVSTALMVVLKGTSSKQQMADRIEPLKPPPPDPSKTETNTVTIESKSQGGTKDGNLP